MDAEGDRRRAAAYAELQDVVKAQLTIAKAQGELKPSGVVDVIIAADALVASFV